MLCAFFGASTGSTGGGIKILRLVILVKAAVAGVLSFARPRALHPVRVDGAAVPEGMVGAATRYFTLWVLVALVGALALATLGSDPETSLTAVVVCLNNVGPGLASVGPAADYGHLSVLAKLLLTFYMILGRLEFFAVAVLFVPGFWRR
jgi:trk system potassium uptake protein TrkH